MKNTNENTFNDIRDEVRNRINQRKLKSQTFMDRLKIKPKEGLDNLRIHRDTVNRQSRLKNTAGKVAVGLAGVGAIGATTKYLINRKKKGRWDTQGCDNIENMDERVQCLQHIRNKQVNQER